MGKVVKKKKILLALTAICLLRKARHRKAVSLGSKLAGTSTAIWHESVIFPLMEMEIEMEILF